MKQSSASTAIWWYYVLLVLGWFVLTDNTTREQEAPATSTHKINNEKNKKNAQRKTTTTTRGKNSTRAPPNNKTSSTIWEAAKLGDLMRIKHLIHRHGTSLINAGNEVNVRLFCLAIFFWAWFHHNTDILFLLWWWMDALTRTKNWTPLHVAAAHGREHVVEWLIKNGAQLNARDNVSDHTIGDSCEMFCQDRKELITHFFVFNWLLLCLNNIGRKYAHRDVFEFSWQTKCRVYIVTTLQQSVINLLAQHEPISGRYTTARCSSEWTCQHYRTVVSAWSRYTYREQGMLRMTVLALLKQHKQHFPTNIYFLLTHAHT